MVLHNSCLRQIGVANIELVSYLSWFRFATDMWLLRSLQGNELHYNINDTCTRCTKKQHVCWYQKNWRPNDFESCVELWTWLSRWWVTKEHDTFRLSQLTQRYRVQFPCSLKAFCTVDEHAHAFGFVQGPFVEEWGVDPLTGPTRVYDASLALENKPSRCYAIVFM